ncbi:hypothetical protein K466DRAFT_478739 [Polyporus arcularius HHB13444]|uniref:VWFA domain-containing protein n=1 Tax=Polyporus arcularius HHB13444 TaxID=1314778 RepID=A0A5C3PXD0_9APHY|nr:hypothetical protein K466DRAFT_478739 [Polyporus arcularius HHB13444]
MLILTIILSSQARRALSQLADLAGQYDESGIDIYFFNNRCWGGDLKDATSVKQLFSSLEPWGKTPFRGRIRELLENYVEDMQTAGFTGRPPKPLIVVILMNEPPTGDDNLAGVIRHYAKLMDERNHPLTQLGIHLVQVDSFRITKKYLQALDEDLNKPGDLRDMLDTTPGGDLTAEKMLKIVLDGVKRRVDKQEKNGSG